jgi:23S rRNA (pseudouridine1915-N3)-methyltransferase
MFKIKIITIGKTKEEWLKAGIEEYTKRLSKSVEITWLLARDDAQLDTLAQTEKGLICLDPGGSLMSSEQFSEYLLGRLELHGSRLSFLIGGAEGIPLSIKQRAESISLSKMTFTHQMTRLILLEQIYRTIEIRKGSGYHK